MLPISGNDMNHNSRLSFYLGKLLVDNKESPQLFIIYSVGAELIYIYIVWYIRCWHKLHYIYLFISDIPQ